MAAAAIELAEKCEREGRTYMALMRWFPAFMIIGFGFANLPYVIEGDTVAAVLYALIVLGSVGHLMFNPATKPKNMARSLEASRQIVAPSDLIQDQIVAVPSTRR